MISLLLQCVSSGVLEPNLQARVPGPPQSPDVSSDNGFVFIVVSFYLQVFLFVCFCFLLQQKNGLEVLGGNVTNSLKKI